MYKHIEKYITQLINDSTEDKYMWNLEKILHNKPMSWNYIDGCMFNSLLELYAITKDETYFNFTKKCIDQFVLEDGSIKTYNIHKHVLDDICESRVLFYLYNHTKDEKYLKAINYTYEHIKVQPRTYEGSFYHKDIYPNQVWLDGFYMTMPFYSNYYNMTKDENILVDILSQYKIARHRLFDDKYQLYYHGYDASKKAFWADKETGLSKSFWLRAMGWFFVSLVDVYGIVENEEFRHELSLLIKELADGVLQYQDSKTKLFYQVVNQGNREPNYVETSGSAMISYALMKASRLNILDSKYKVIGKEIFDGICEHALAINDDKLTLKGICLVAGLGPENNTRRDGTFEYYMSEPVVENDAKGVAPFIMAYVEVKRDLNA